LDEIQGRQKQGAGGEAALWAVEEEACSDGDDTPSQVPVLNLTAFEDYLVRENALFTPDGTCAADSSWARLLHALGIRPGMEVLDWRPREDSDAGAAPGVVMLLDGAVFCHIVNLFGEEPDPFGRRHVHTKSNGGYSLEFGSLLVWRKAAQIYADFSLLSKSWLSAKRKPLGRVGAKMESGVLAIAYLNAWRYGVSNSELSWPDPNSTADADRMRKLLSNFAAVETAEKPILLTHEWLQNADRVKRRVLTDGGNNLSFLNDIIQTIGAQPNMSLIAQEDATRFIRDQFFGAGSPGNEVEGPGFAYMVGTTGSISNKTLVVPPKQIARQVLGTYANEPEGTFKKKLHGNLDLVMEVLFLGRLLQLNGLTRVLEFQADDPDWTQKVRLSPNLDW
jgi:hypothetical protein